MEEKPQRVVYEEAARALDSQRHTLEALRGRATGLFAAAAIVVALLGGTTLEAGRGLSTLRWTAIGFFIAVLVLTLLIQGGWFLRWSDHDDPERLRDRHLGEQPSSEGTIYGDLVDEYIKKRKHNHKQLTARFVLFRLASVALLVETVLWLTDVA